MGHWDFISKEGNELGVVRIRDEQEPSDVPTTLAFF